MKAFKNFRWVLAISSVGLLLASSVRWVFAQSMQTLKTPPRNSLPSVAVPNWDATAAQFREAYRIAINEWIGRARIQGGKVRGSAAILTPGSLVSDVNVEMRMMEILASWQVPNEISRAGAGTLASAWNDWAANFQMHIPAAYPKFAAVPGPKASATLAAVAPRVSAGSSTGEASFSTPVLAERLSSALRPYATKGQQGMPDQAMADLANWVEASFSQWKNAVTLIGLTGQGSVPTFAPPYVPVGPVTSGETVSAGPPFAGPRFGIVVR